MKSSLRPYGLAEIPSCVDAIKLVAAAHSLRHPDAKPLQVKKVPLMLMHGEEDRIVPLRHGVEVARVSRGGAGLEP